MEGSEGSPIKWGFFVVSGVRRKASVGYIMYTVALKNSARIKRMLTCVVLTCRYINWQLNCSRLHDLSERRRRKLLAVIVAHVAGIAYQLASLTMRAIAHASLATTGTSYLLHATVIVRRGSTYDEAFSI